MNPCPPELIASSYLHKDIHHLIKILLNHHQDLGEVHVPCFVLLLDLPYHLVAIDDRFEAEDRAFLLIELESVIIVVIRTRPATFITSRTRE